MIWEEAPESETNWSSELTFPARALTNLSDGPTSRLGWEGNLGRAIPFDFTGSEGKPMATFRAPRPVPFASGIRDPYGFLSNLKFPLHAACGSDLQDAKTCLSPCASISAYGFDRLTHRSIVLCFTVPSSFINHMERQTKNAD
jgi:hypothetical protein